MKGTKVAARYAKSLLDLTIEQGKLEEAYNDMLRVNELLSNNRDMQLLLSSPIVKTDKKQSIIEAVFGNDLSELTLSFIRLITSRRREYLLERSEEHTSELQSPDHLVCRLLLEKKNNIKKYI